MPDEIENSRYRICASYCETAASMIEQIDLSEMRRNRYWVARELTDIAAFLRTKADGPKKTHIVNLDDIARWEEKNG